MQHCASVGTVLAFQTFQLYIPGPSNRSPPATFKSPKPPEETCWRVLVAVSKSQCLKANVCWCNLNHHIPKITFSQDHFGC